VYDVEGVLGAQIARMGRLDLTTGHIILCLLFQGSHLGLGQDDVFLGYLRLQGLETIPEVGQILA
jgi:hypothetical protein